MFISPNNKEKELSISQLGAHVRALIKLADPASKVKVHRVRKMSASHSFAESMVVGDLMSTFQWSSPAVFYRHYFTQPETLSNLWSALSKTPLLGHLLSPLSFQHARYLRYPITSLVATNTLPSTIVRLLLDYELTY